ncbi:hypothetical protein [Luteolibacter marinus]|uniref:hypothetical protein n=1 Tax=Luteolibacter marinus TaxID=2776705 RepID=UPI001868E8D9|nr:hypothetical protein [Luteolibacter marinus]
MRTLVRDLLCSTAPDGRVRTLRDSRAFSFLEISGGLRGGNLQITVVTLAVFALLSPSRGAQVDLAGPAGSGAFGTAVTVLPNGNFVVTDPGYDLPGGASNVGAVYLYDPNGNRISSLTGTTNSDAVGSGGIFLVGSGNFVIRSPDWSAGSGKHDAGAVTWVSGSTGLSGVVSVANSLVGSKANDQVGSAGTSMGGITVLANGNYVVSSHNWGNGSADRVGAVTWGSGDSGVTGEVSAANSLVGSTLNDQIGRYRVESLKNGNYVVRSPQWDHGALADAGAVTWGSGNGGTVGIVGPSISLVGGSAGDQVGFDDDYRGGVTLLGNGSYVVWSPFWDNSGAADAGAVTWGDGTTGRSGVISAANSVVGMTAEDFLSWVEVTELANGNFVLALPGWDNGGAVNAGAAMWCDGALGRSGAVSSANALVGNAANALVAYKEGAVTPLANGNYVVASTYWHNGAAVNAGAVTWCDGSTGRTGVVSTSNSLVGTGSSNNIGSGGVVALPNGHYVVCSPYAQVGSLGQAGAATWCDGTSGRTGTISAANSLVGAQAGDQVGLDGAVVLTNGNYVVTSFYARNGALTTAGAVTWCPGATGRAGAISLANSLMGGTAGDRVGVGGVTPLANGHYVVQSGTWKNPSGASVGAVTWGNGVSGTSGTVTAANSLTGATAGDNAGYPGVIALPNGHYVVPSWYWDNGAAADAGAVTWGDGEGGTTGVISAANSLVGSSASDQIGYGGLVVLPSGDYVVRSYLWDNGPATNAGAVTRGSAAAGVSGIVSAANSLVGTVANDRVGEGPDLATADGAYLFSSPKWNHGELSDAGSVMLLPPGGGIVGGEISAAAGVLGVVATRGSSHSFGFDESRCRMVAGRPYSNVVSLYSDGEVFSPAEKYERWATAANLTGESALPSSVPFDDGIANLLKYAFNLSATGPDVRVLVPGAGLAGLPCFALVEGEDGPLFRLEYLRRSDSGLIYQPMISPSLAAESFGPMTGLEIVTGIDDFWERVVIEESVDLSVTPRLFGRIAVELP